MRIFVVAHNCRRGGGISVAQNLIAAMSKAAPQNLLFCTIPSDLAFEEFCGGAPRIQWHAYKHTSLMARAWWDAFRLPRLVREFAPDVILNMANQGFVKPLAPQATYVQDPHIYYPPSQYGRISLRERSICSYHRLHFLRCARRTPLVFCQTRVAQQRLRPICGPNTEIALCPNSVSVRVTAANDTRCPEALRGREGKLRLLVLTRYYEHKNLEIIPEVFRRHRRELAEVNVILTLDPGEHPRAAKLMRTISDYGLCDSIFTVGPLRQEQLAAYYLNTDALFMPTLLESFSGTYAEAMAYGRPVLTSDMDFARDVCGDAAIYFDPRNTASICEAILRCGAPEARRSLSRNAAKQRNVYSSDWGQIAEGVLSGLRSIAGTGS